MEINFCEYLINIGLINKESFSNLILDYHKKSSNKNFVENMTQILSKFFENVSKEEKNFMSSNLVINYLQYLAHQKIYKLKILYMILKEKIMKIKIKYLFKWKLYSYFNKESNNQSMECFESINNPIKKINKKINRKRNANKELENHISTKINEDRMKNLLNKSKKKKVKNISLSQNESTLKKFDSTKETMNKKNNNKNLNERPSSPSDKEQNELKECTFSPKINEYYKIKNKNKPNNSKNKMIFDIFYKLHRDDIIYKNKIQLSKEKYEQKLKEENTFRPRLNNNSLNNRYLTKSNKSFTERQKMFLEKREKKTEKIKKSLEDNCSKLCSFMPEININNNSLNKSKLKNELNTDIVISDKICDFYTSRTGEGVISTERSPFLRLYEESKNRNERKIQREKYFNNYINSMANISCKKENNINYDKINELYLYEKKNDIIKKTKRKVENEEGSTFRPEIYINNTIKNVTSNFYERNKKFINDKKTFIENSIKERDKLYNKNNNSFKDIKNNFSKEEKKEIIKNIVQRLANEGGG